MTEENTVENQQGNSEERPEDTGPQAEDRVQPYMVFRTKEEHQNHLDNIVKGRLERAEKKAAQDREKAAQEARDKALEDQKDWEKLALERSNRIQVLEKEKEEFVANQQHAEDLQKRLDNLEDRLKATIKGPLELVPELFRPFVQDMSVEEQAQWLETNAEKLGEPQSPSGSRPSPRAVASGDRSQATQKDQEALERYEQAMRGAF